MTTIDMLPELPEESEPSTADTASGPRADYAKRRTFTAEYKRQIVAEYDQAAHGEKGSILRRERLYDSHIQEWRAANTAGLLATGTRKGRPAGSARTAEQKRIVELERENAKLRGEALKKDRVIADRDAALEVLGKGVSFLEALSSRNRS
ncbi:transposase [Leucobacter insecticola]|uniref:Transposase n=1 Tax=Leucobacter insecticola TaxID=2714934 RepID=A0A6G8FKX0_9MICO|nr:transposase [Leucobacter insecticola]QIM16933.1 transposase [Leucobacter insecticola]QIM17152.1 transposase [Leucobacter insecticola]